MTDKKSNSIIGIGTMLCCTEGKSPVYVRRAARRALPHIKRGTDESVTILVSTNEALVVLLDRVYRDLI